MPKKTYTKQEILKILEIYVINKYSVKKTSEQTHIARNTLKSWINKYPISKQPELQAEIQKTAITEVTELFTPEVVESRNEVSDDIDGTKDKLLKKINDLIPDCRSIDALSRAYQILHMCQQGINPMGGGGDVYNTINLVQMYGKELDQKNLPPSNE